MVQARNHRPPQIRLSQPSHGGVDRRQRLGQVAACRLEGGVHHGQTHEPALNLTPRPDAVTHRQRLLVRRVKTKKPHHASVRAIVHRHQQLAARPHRDLAGRHGGLDLRGIALAHIAQLHDARLVLVAQRQVQRQVNVTLEPQLNQRLLGSAERFGWRGFGRGRHGLIVPCLGAHERRLIAAVPWGLQAVRTQRATHAISSGGCLPPILLGLENI